MISKRKKRLEAKIGTFISQYKRKAHAGSNSNDRSYDRSLEKKIKSMSPEELDELMRGTEDDDEKDQEIT